MKKIIIILSVLVFSNLCTQAQTVTDIDGNVYTTVTIGTQVWLRENLKVTHYRNGDPIPHVNSGSTWSGLTTGAYCHYDNSTVNADVYGRLYNFNAVADARGLAPDGWHVPTDEDWTTLSNYLGGENIAGGKMKETGTVHWVSAPGCVTNEFDFTALPGGYRMRSGEYTSMRYLGTWWTATENTTSEAWGRGMFSDGCQLDKGAAHEKQMGQSIRCVRDALVGNTGVKSQVLLLVYPNPASERLYVKFGNNMPVVISIRTMTGESVLQKNILDGSAEIDLSCLKRGVYLLDFYAGSWTGQRKLIRE